MAMIHDLEPGKDGLMYVVDMANDSVATLNPETAERAEYAIPGGKEPGTDETAIKGPHSIEVAENGDMWLTLALSGQMAKFDPKSNKSRLYNKVASGNASESEIRQLKALCMLDGDRACRAMAVNALKALKK